LINNLTYALYGQIQKNVTNGQVTWTIPCDPNSTATINGIPRVAGEGLLCYIIRALNLTTATAGYVTANGFETLTNKTLTAPVINGAALSGTINGGTFTSTILTSPTINTATINTPAINTPTINTATINTATISNLTATGTLALPSGSITTAMIANGTIVPEDLSAGGPSWDASGNLTATSSTGARIRAGGAVGAGFEFNGPDSRFDTPSANTIAAYTSNLERLRIDNVGNVGIGINSPSEKLHVAGNIRQTRGAADYNVLAIANTSGVEVQLNANGNSEGNLRTITNHPLSFSTNNLARLIIGNTGVIDTNGNTIINCPVTCKAWGGASSAGVINATTYGVSTITQSGLGNYLVTMFVAINGYSIVATPDSAVGNQATAALVSTTQFRVYTYGGSGSAANVAFKFAVFGV